MQNMRIQMLDFMFDEKQAALDSRHFLILADLFRKAGCEVDYLYKKDLKWFYPQYLKFKPDVVISVHEEGPVPTIFKKLHLLRAPHVHDWVDDYTDINGKEHGIAFIAFCEYYTVANADFIITPSVYRKERCDLWGKRAFYIPHGVESDFDAKPLKSLQGKVKVVYAGEQSERKGVGNLIAAAAGLDCELYLIGRVNEAYSQRFRPNVHFLGQVDHTEIPGYLKAADILVMPADNDSTFKMFEYLKARAAILARRGKTGYVLTHLENAYLTDDLASGLRELMANPELRDRLREGTGRMKIHTWNEVAGMWLECLDQAINEYHSPEWHIRKRRPGSKSLFRFMKSI
jgi:glycosyltransferase involved in cell wall biosynthesis